MAEETTTTITEETTKTAPVVEAEVEATDEDDAPVSKEKAKKLASEAKNLRDRLKAAEDKLQAKADAELSDLEKAKQDAERERETNSKLSANTRNLLLHGAIEELKGTMGVRSVKSMAKLIDADKLTFDLESNTVEGVADELKRLKKDDPDLFISGGTDGGAGGNGRAQTTDMNAMLRKQLMGR